MSDIQDMIHTQTMNSYEKGQQVERERIIKLLENKKFILPKGIDEGLTLMPIQEAIALIKGEK